MPADLKGLVPPIVTPLLAENKIDAEGVKKLIEHLIAGGVNGLFVLGSIGEFASMSMETKMELITLACKVVDGRVPVLVGITDPCFTNTVQLAATAKEAGARAVVLSPQYYYPSEQFEVIKYVEDVLDAIELEMLVYHIPDFTKVGYSLETLEYLTKHERIIGVKDTGGDLEYFKKLCQIKADKRPDWSIFQGLEQYMFDSIALGGDGCVVCGCNVMPKVFAEAYKAAITGTDEEKAACKAKIASLYPVYTKSTKPVRLLAGTKVALVLLGIIDSDLMNRPWTPYTPEEREEAKKVMDTLDL